MLVGKQVEGVWHTSVVIERGERSREFFFGGPCAMKRALSHPFCYACCSSL